MDRMHHPVPSANEQGNTIRTSATGRYRRQLSLGAVGVADCPIVDACKGGKRCPDDRHRHVGGIQSSGPRACKSQSGHRLRDRGVHPHGAKSYDPSTFRELTELWKCPEVVAVGECGLDYNRNFSTPQTQRIAFEQQLSMAVATRKPLFLHCRDAFIDFHDMLTPVVADGARGVVHCFTGNRAEAEAFLAMGLDIGITGWVTDLQRGQALREALPAIPLDRLHLETDAPYLFPKNAETRRGHNEPANLPWVAASVAELMGRDVDEIIRACSSNSRRMFDLPGN